MEQGSSEKKNLENLDSQRMNLLVTIWKKRKLLFWISSAALVISTVVAFLMTPLFRSTAIVFPAATSTVSFSEQRNAKASAMDFGEEESAEQLVQILASSQIRNLVVSRFDLMKHYEIEENDLEKHHKLVKEYENHISFERTRYGSIQIDVLDRDPKLAMEIANKIVDLIDTVKNLMVQERTVFAFDINKRKKEQLEKEIAADEVVLDSLGTLGVVPQETRANLFAAYVDAKSGEDRALFKNQIDVNLKYGASFDGMEEHRNEMIVKLNKFLDSYEQAESDANTQFNHKFVVERAVVADKKDKPKRLFVMLFSTIATFIFAVFVLLILDKLKELRKID